MVPHFGWPVGGVTRAGRLNSAALMSLQFIAMQPENGAAQRALWGDLEAGAMKMKIAQLLAPDERPAVGRCPMLGGSVGGQ
jgi:hypothetical protein